MPVPTAPTERLDVEDDDRRELRLRQMLQRIDDESSNLSGSGNSPAGPSSQAELSFDFGVREETHAVEPPRELLARLDAILPQMEAANAELSRRMEAEPESVDIEQLGEHEAEYIEMNLGVGVFDLGRRRASDSSSTCSSTSSSSDESEGTSSEIGTGSDSDSDSDSSTSTSVIRGSSSSRLIRPLPNRARQIVVLSDSPSNNHPPDNTDQS